MSLYPKIDYEVGELEFCRHKWNPEKEYPYCSIHGAMNKVSKHGIWRCLVCHIGWNERTNEFLANSTQGFRKTNDKKRNNNQKETVQRLGMYLRGMNRLFPKIKQVAHVQVANPNKYDEGFGDGKWCYLDDYIADFLKVCDKLFETFSQKNYKKQTNK